MKSVIIIGCGGHAAELREYIDDHNKVSLSDAHIHVIGYIDDNVLGYHHYGFIEPYLGQISNHEINLVTPPRISDNRN